MPVIFTLLGQGSFPESHPLSLGLMGMHGHREVNKALEECDLLVNIGARFDDRATGKVVDICSQTRKIVHVDIDPAEIGKNIHTDVPVVGDAREVLKLMIPEVEQRDSLRVDGLDRLAERPSLRSALDERPEWPEPYTIIKEHRDKPPMARRSSQPMLGSTRCGPHSTLGSIIRIGG